jgi:hypothetical protein
MKLHSFGRAMPNQDKIGERTTQTRAAAAVAISETSVLYTNMSKQPNNSSVCEAFAKF